MIAAHSTVSTQVDLSDHVTIFVPFEPALFEALPWDDADFNPLTCRLDLEDAVMYFVDVDSELRELIVGSHFTAVVEFEGGKFRSTAMMERWW